jgi:cytochrome c peroxidase
LNSDLSRSDIVTPVVVDKSAAIVLGKALFWDQSIGSDGQSCASCHFHAGGDFRIKNQIIDPAF